MIKTRVASAAAIFSFGVAALGGAVVAVAAPASADTQPIVQVEGTSMTGTAGPAVNDARVVSEELATATRGPGVATVPAPGSAAVQDHTPFPHNAAPHSEHNGQGHKGSNELGAH